MAGKTGGFCVLAAFLVILGLGLVGCGPKPPCEGAGVTDVQSVQDECAAATDELEQAREDRANLEAEVTETKAEIAALEGQPSELEGRLHDLKKGSGR